MNGTGTLTLLALLHQLSYQAYCMACHSTECFKSFICYCSTSIIITAKIINIKIVSIRSSNEISLTKTHSQNVVAFFFIFFIIIIFFWGGGVDGVDQFSKKHSFSKIQ